MQLGKPIYCNFIYKQKLLSAVKFQIQNGGKLKSLKNSMKTAPYIKPLQE